MRINYYNNIDKKLKITMATKRKSIIEEALLEAKSLEDALKANTKEMLATHMKQEIESIVESSLKVKDEESKNDIVEGSDEKTEVPVLKEQKEDEESEELVLIDAGEDSEEDAEDEESGEIDPRWDALKKLKK